MRPKCTRTCLNCHKAFTCRRPSDIARGGCKYCSWECFNAHKDARTKSAQFWQHMDQAVGPDKCWEWTGNRNTSGYGRLHYRGRSTLAHRVAYELTHGPIPPDLSVLHRCDNPLCCNPAHLWLGTPADNTRDMCLKGRAKTVITPEVVRAIRREYAEGETTYRALAAAYGITNGTVCKIVHRTNWKYLD